MIDNQLSALIRRVQPESFDQNAHGPGFCFEMDKAGRSIEGRLGDGGIAKKLLSMGKKRPVIFVKSMRRPYAINDWVFEWVEGTSNVTLKFEANFDIAVRNDDDARRLAEALCHNEDLGQSLHEIIDGRLHDAMSESFRRCNEQDKDVLSIFMGQSVSGVSTDLNQTVSSDVSMDLGNIPFRIGLALKVDAPFTIEIKHKTSFEVQDSDKRRQVESTAFLELRNYQRFRSSRCANRDDVIATVRAAIDKAVNRHLFGRPYWEIVSCFDDTAAAQDAGNARNDHIEDAVILDDDDKPIKVTIEERLAATAASIGYKLKIFQTFLDIESLQLLKGMRIALPAEESEFQTKNSSGYVKLGVSLDVRAHNFDKLRHLIAPDEPDIEGAIAAEVKRICSDEVLSIDRKEFDLNFEPDVKARIISKLEDVLLSSHGLSLDNIRVSPEKTVEAERYNALKGKTQPLELRISPQADSATTDEVKISAAFEIVSMDEGGWELFDGKDFGYRDDSQYWNYDTEQTLINRLGMPIAEAPEAIVRRERRAIAVRRELDDIGSRIKAVLESTFQMYPDLADKLRDLRDNQEVKFQAEALAQDAIKKEFGLIIELREFKREDTDTDLTNKLIHEDTHKRVREDLALGRKHTADARKDERQYELEYARDLRKKRDELRATVDATDGDPIAEEELAEVEKRLAAITGGSTRKELSVESARKAIARKTKKSDDFYEQLRRNRLDGPGDSS